MIMSDLVPDRIHSGTAGVDQPAAKRIRGMGKKMLWAFP